MNTRSRETNQCGFCRCENMMCPSGCSASTTLLSTYTRFSLVRAFAFPYSCDYGDWLGIKTQRLRDINGLAFRTPVDVGQRIKLDLSQVDAAAFENLRTTYHRHQQDSFFRNHTITGVNEHTIKRNESVWILSLRKYDVPIWLFRQYNPSLDLHKVQPGTRVRFPVLVSNNG